MERVSRARARAAEQPVRLGRLEVVHGCHRAPTAEGKVYLAVVLDAFSRRVVGWSIAATNGEPTAGNLLGRIALQISPLWRRPVPSTWNQYGCVESRSGS